MENFLYTHRLKNEERDLARRVFAAYNFNIYGVSDYCMSIHRKMNGLNNVDSGGLILEYSNSFLKSKLEKFEMKQFSNFRNYATVTDISKIKNPTPEDWFIKDVEKVLSSNKVSLVCGLGNNFMGNIYPGERKYMGLKRGCSSNEDEENKKEKEDYSYMF